MTTGRVNGESRRIRQQIAVGQWIALLGVASSIAGCAPKSLYDWGSYEESLQATYVSHDEDAAWLHLEDTIIAAQRTGGRLPPGAVAEYGFLHYRRGQPEKAIALFEQEASLFPESKPLMDKLIARVREQMDSKVRAPDGVSTQP